MGYVVTDPELYAKWSRPNPVALDVRPRKEPPAPKPIDGSRQWAELHRWAMASTGAEDTRWLLLFRLRVPCGVCRQHWDEMCTASPPAWGDLFAWTVARHNEVNRRLGKPEMTLEEAREKWSATP